MNIYPDYVFFDKLISPLTDYQCKRINNQNIKQFGFSTIDELHLMFPNFPLRCHQNQLHQNENNKTMYNGYKQYSKKRRTKLEKDYKKSPKKCLHCNKNITFEKRKNEFCSHSCSASYNNKLKEVVSSETREKISKKISNALSGRQKICKISFCKVCGASIPNKRIMSCSDYCKRKLLSASLKKAFEEGYHKGNLYRSRNNPSYMERSFNQWLIDSDCTYVWELEQPFKRYDENGNYEKCYFADFFFPELKLIIELDGDHHKKQKEYDKDRDIYIIENNVCVNTIIRITHKEYISHSRIDEIKSLLNIS